MRSTARLILGVNMLYAGDRARIRLSYGDQFMLGEKIPAAGTLMTPQVGCA